jgi:hypothetical protein
MTRPFLDGFDFWKMSTKEILEELYGILVADVGMGVKEADEYVEALYWNMAAEYDE